MKQHFLLLGRGYAHFRSGTLTQIIYMRVKDVKDAAIRQRPGFEIVFPVPDTSSSLVGTSASSSSVLFFTALKTEGVNNFHV